MELTNKLKNLSEKIINLKDQIETEEATKTAFILPFISLLGYDIFNPTEVIPEFTADIGLKKGEKVDYAIIENKVPILIIECKHWKENLDTHNSQLFRYFHTSKSKFALLTNGVEYKFFTDLDATNKMDEKPFLEFDITKLKEPVINEIAKFHKANFDINQIVNNASSLKYSKEIKKIFSTQLVEPESDFIRFFTSRVYSGRQTEKVIEQFKELVSKSINQFISEKVNDRLHSALNKEEEKFVEENKEPEQESKIITTEEEMEGFRIVVAILRKRIPVERIAFRDTQSYFGILLDDNNRKPLCRLHFNGKTKYLGVFNETRKEVKEKIESIEDIYKFDTALLKTIDYYEEYATEKVS
ncbi:MULTISPECIES: type I restriction endonuclease [unclassified Tenacibaculum]|uniref:type I restriction endonuclease n=1 Tax=unclassified Tenacibaculum TaxID=2635139 RepID=UPI001EEA5410|nr:MULTISPECIES: type I restriction endonuclease [unclassified Tenacibaculum]MCF2875072.1 type I restriction enzyme HsdR N-terminal domain-containing protein [Tenacibaculum sp. Cn5-1]MCF2935148.1 type I restriction enzyme HsdR N-terminal domain-containing protein [Tenacibaculum sp. Cn5-34]MCG7511410.1 type I restriction endonuclease [Tenacibaculum sp. Cn5-46]